MFLNIYYNNVMILKNNYFCREVSDPLSRQENRKRLTMKQIQKAYSSLDDNRTSDSGGSYRRKLLAGYLDLYKGRRILLLPGDPEACEK